ncbi:STM4504/CBY_0614 family protein [Microbulbifer spongiae]|uniref:Abortive infection protein-like C-terminal domain-containing protein n=1 Tax=Microbulbifer spongiae TaxID=2944933 RepID=A0ABY9E5M4_9GAMM|nr:hypothetical protein [Microbulbifer sp. MI-G]WKD48323.1 hypothetical protein M8T91_10290 [Microbulbifer sp. MI-G]
MTVTELYSKRQKRLHGEVVDVYTYDNIPKSLRIQIIYIWRDTLGKIGKSLGRNEDHAYKIIVSTLCREFGLFQLSHVNKYKYREYTSELENFFLEENKTDRVLDAIEISFKIIDKKTRGYQYLGRRDASERADRAINELNSRFKEHGIGFQFENGEIIRIDSELMHTEAVKPAIRLLNSKQYEGAQQEFLSAYDHYRHGKHKESLNDCLKAFESTMKAICEKQNWPYQSNDTAKSLIKICFERELVPTFWQQQLNSLRSILESSIPTGRNRLSAHGQGSNPTSIPDHLVGYMLHMTASTLVFLTKAEQELANKANQQVKK